MLLLSILYGFAVSAICVLLLGKLVEGNLNRSSKGRKTSPSSPPNTSEGVRGRTRQGSFSASPPPPAQSVHTMLGEPERPQRARGTTRSSTPAGPPRTQSDDPKEDQASAPSSSSAPVVRLTRPPPPSILIGDEGAPQQQLQKKKLSFVSSTDALQGRRDGMEDSHISIDELARYFPDTFLAFQQRGLPNAFYGIYDGHVGKRASTFVSDVLHDRICRHPSFVVDSLVPSAEGSDDDAVADKPTISEEAKSGILKALEEGFLQTDKEFIEDAVKAENKWKDGTTAVVAMLLDSHLFLANLGDSEALLGQREYDQSAGVWRESFEVVSELHKPTMPAERARIEKEGGFIVGGRVGGLSVSRSFGDRNMKLPIEEDGFWHGVLVDPHPYVAHRQLTSKDCFLLLGCDGVWENWTHQESVDFVFEKLDQGLTVDELTEATTKRAMEKGSMDNISATIILFKWE